MKYFICMNMNRERRMRSNAKNEKNVDPIHSTAKKRKISEDINNVENANKMPIDSNLPISYQPFPAWSIRSNLLADRPCASRPIQSENSDHERKSNQSVLYSKSFQAANLDVVNLDVLRRKCFGNNSSFVSSHSKPFQVEEEEATHTIIKDTCTAPTPPRITISTYRNQEYTNIPKYDLEEDRVPQKRRKRILREWQRSEEFENALLAKNAVEAEKCWSISTTNESIEGTKVFYRCNIAKLRGYQCESGIYLLYDASSPHVIMYKATNPHSCYEPEKIRPYMPMGAEVKKRITEYFDNGIRSRKALLAKLESAKIDMPSANQLNKFIRTLRDQKLRPMSITIGELETLLLNYTAIPDDADEGFIVRHECDNRDKANFRFVISSKKLLRNLIDADVFSCDSTYKMTWQSFSLSPCGTIDKDRHFHLCGLMVSKEEKTADYEFMFRSLKEATAVVHGYPFQPKVLISNASPAIHNAFTMVFGLKLLILMCWHHMKKAFKKQLMELCQEKTVHTEILNDLDYLQVAQTPRIFEIAAGLFLDKHKKHEKFCKYFTDEWLINNKNWYEGAKPSTINAPSSNNAMARWNRLVKSEKCLRARYPLNQFIDLLRKWTKEWSEEYNNGAKVFVKTPTVNLKLWAESYQWVRLNTNLEPITEEMSGLYCYDLAAGRETLIPQILSPSEWIDFQQYKEAAFKRWRTYISDNWKSGTCNCPQFFKQSMCKHIIGIAARLKYVEIPVEAKTFPIEQKHKQGRRKKSNPCRGTG